MYENDFYNCYFKDNNMVYSIDMIRLKTYITYSQFSEIEFMLKFSLKDKIKRFWLSDRIMQFHYNYVLEFDDHSFWFGFMHNSESVNYNKDNLEYNFTIEFNPNKLKDNSFILHLLDKFGNWFIKSFDLAIDIPINIRDIVFDIGSRRKVETRSYGGDDISYRVGSGNGRYKIYNKKNESGLNIVGYLTRVEVSIDVDDFPVKDIKRYRFDEMYFPLLYLNQYIFSFDDYISKDKTTLALLYAVQSGYPMKELSRVYRTKIKKLLEGGSSIKFSRLVAEDIFKKTIYFYFIRRGCKQVIF